MKKSVRPTILFIKPHESPFFDTDEKILGERYVIKSFLVHQRNKKKHLLKLFELVIFLIKNIFSAKILIVWFADYSAAIMVFIGKMSGKNTVIFAGGQEAICYKELGKGVYLKKIRGAFVRFAIRNATYVLPNHQSLIYHENYFYNPEHPHIDGIQYYVSNIRSKVIVVPNGIDPKRIDYNPSVKKQPNLVFTVGNMNQISDFYNKGFDLFIESARRNPDLSFIIVSIKERFLSWVETNYKISEISNLKIVSTFCSDDELLEYYHKTKVYVQVSITEGMPVSLSEAMLCQCIPVGSNVNGIPDAIGPYGIIIYRRDIEELNQAIRKALLLETGSLARQYVIDNFSIEVRKNILLDIFKSMD